MHGNAREGALELAQIVGRQLDGSCADVLSRPFGFVVPGIGTIHGF